LLLLAAALLFSIGASVPIACCAGVASGAHATAAGVPPHCGGGEGCCDRAADDAVARHCCQGGDAFERPQVGQQPALAAAATAIAPVTPVSTAGGDGSPSPRDPVPRIEPLYTLHSSLLI
jgi:hypothetical protein